MSRGWSPADVDPVPTSWMRVGVRENSNMTSPDCSVWVDRDGIKSQGRSGDQVDTPKKCLFPDPPESEARNAEAQDLEMKNGRTPTS